MFLRDVPPRFSLRVLPALVLTAALAGCASIGTPGGGWYDETPPQLRSVNPADGATGVSRQKIVLHFDENVKLDGVMDKMTVSPPQVKAPQVTSNAKTVTIELLDSLLPSTTYSIDLGDAVQDNNEGNPLPSLAFTFSTGDHIDSLRVAGYLLNAADLEPITGAYVGIYKVRAWEGDGASTADSAADLTAAAGPTLPPAPAPGVPDSLRRAQDSIIALHPDSVFVLRPFERAGKTDALGHFEIRGIAPGAYRVYALVDGNTNYRYDLESEDIAFLDTVVVPTMSGQVVRDTVWADSQTTDTAAIDTIIVTDRTVYHPDDLLLRAFNEGRVVRYLDDFGRPDSLRLTLRMSAHMPSLPTLALLKAEGDSIVADTDRPLSLVAEPNPTLDTLTYWLADSALIASDTLLLAVTYLYTDTCGDVDRTDTLRFVRPADKAPWRKGRDEGEGRSADKGRKRRKHKDDEPAPAADSIPPTVFMTARCLTPSIDIGRKPRFEVSAPLGDIDLEGLHLERQQDSTWVAMPFRWEADSLALRRYVLFGEPHYEPGGSYRLRVDSAAMHDIYGHPVDSLALTFSEKKRDEYAHLLLTITGAREPAFVQLLDSKDTPVAQAPVKGGQAKFVNIAAGKYYARLVEDPNGNGRFDTGDLMRHVQPERVYYLDALLELRAGWDFSQAWNVHSLPLHQQKPLEVKQNKPKEEKEKKSKNAEYYEKMGKTPPQTYTGTTTQSNKNQSMRIVK